LLFLAYKVTINHY